jgi:lysophospholipase L1-like esterase
LPNPYQFEGSHPTELGHLVIADRIEELLKQRQAT